MSDPEQDDQSQGRPARRGRPLLVALGFLLALAATAVTVLMTGLMLRG